MNEINEVETLLKSDSLNRVESLISKKVGASIYKDDLPILIGIIKKEIDCSEISVGEISRFIVGNEKIIIDFGCLLLERRAVQMLSIGISITYAIYLIFLQKKNDTLLKEYLKKRRMPDAILFFNQLKDIEQQLSIL